MLIARRRPERLNVRGSNLRPAQTMEDCMEIELDAYKMYIIQHKDDGAMMKLFYAQRLHCDYDYTSGEYCFYDEADYLAAMLMI